MGEHYYSEEQSSAYNPFLISIRPHGADEFSLYSASGVFSLKHLDVGTEVLLRYCEVPQTGDICDLGCGYGVVGIYLLKKNSDLNLTFVDSSQRAIMLTKKNLDHCSLSGICKVSNILNQLDGKMFDLILTNPPYSAGRKICFTFIEESFTHLNKLGSFQLVCRRQKGGDVLEAHMKEIFGNVCVIGQKSGFRVYKSIKE